MPKEKIYDRRNFLGNAVMTLGAAELAMLGYLSDKFVESSIKISKNKSITNASFDELKQINAGVLNVGYVDAGPVDGKVIVLLHGWPYDIHTYADVAPLLESAGYRVTALLPMNLSRSAGNTKYKDDFSFHDLLFNVF